MGSLEKSIKHIDAKKISFDPNNPRGEKEHQIISDPEFSKLVQSIETYGILEPLIAKKDEAIDDHYTLVDGERRLRAAIELEKKQGKFDVPILTANNSAEGRRLAYQVHMLRKNWGKAAETKSIKSIILDIKKENASITDSELKKKLEDITSHKSHEIDDLLKLIKYDDDIIEKVISKEFDVSYLVQIESSFISPLKRKYHDLVLKYGEDNLRTILVQKALDGLLGNTRFLMDYFKYVFQDGQRKDKIKELLTDYLTNKTKDIKTTFEEYCIINPAIGKAAGMAKRKKKFSQQKHATAKTSTTYKKIKLTSKQVTSLSDIRKRFESVGKKLNDEEVEYISEALFCVENSCRKAAVLMIWAAGISRIIFYISKRLDEFKNDCDSMSQSKKLPYKNYAGPMKEKAAKVDTSDDLRDGKDMILVLYLLYKKIITLPQYKKLKADYDTRCDCAHPTSIDLSPNDVIKIFEDVYSLLFSKL